MRLVYLLQALFCLLFTYSYSQELVPLTGNYSLQKLNAEHKEVGIDLREDLSCDGLEQEGIIYLRAGQVFQDKLVIDTLQSGNLPGSFMCNNCDNLRFGNARLVNDTLIYEVNGDVITGIETINAQFCNSNGCQTYSYSFIVRRNNQRYSFPGISLKADNSTSIELPVNNLPAPVECFALTMCPDNYEGEAEKIDLGYKGSPSKLTLDYTAGSFAGVDIVCAVACDGFAICDTFQYDFRISQDTFKIPFLDDFSYSGPYPSKRHWLDRNIFVNNDMAIDPVSVGVATFDGLDKNGEPYGNGYAVSDYLTSSYLDLSDQQTSTIFLTYFLQKKGLVDKPEPGDSLVLEFKTKSGQWMNIRAVPGIPISQPNSVIDSFMFYSEPITNEFKYNGFQFRFKNYSNGTGILDTWHLDYVKLDITDSIVADVAFTKIPSPILLGYTSLPWRHFKGNEAALLKNSIDVGVYNLSDQALPISSSNVSLVETISKTNLIGSNGVTIFNGDQANIPFGIPVNKNYLLENDPNGFPSVFSGYLQAMQSPAFDNLDRPTFLMSYTLNNTSQANDPGLEAISQNDRVEKTTVFDNYFAYDDGTAEAGFVVQAGNQAAVRFTASVDDSLRAVQFHFPHTSIDISEQVFDLKVWLNTPNSTPVFEAFNVQPYYTDLFFDTLQGFTTFPLVDEEGKNSPVFIPAGDFYVGWEQVTPCGSLQCIPVGFDKNNPTGKDFIMVRDNGVWDVLEDFFPEGALMVRPVVGDETPPPTFTSTNDQPIPDGSFHIYPNPTSDFLNIQITAPDFQPSQYQIVNVVGQVVQHGKDWQRIDVSGLESGIYFIRLVDKSLKWGPVKRFALKR